jgi:hypothetical protein
MITFACRRCDARLTGAVREVALPDPAGRTPSADGPIPWVGRGTFAPDRGEFVLHPGEVRGVRPHDDPGRSSGCCDLAGLDGANLVCESCGSEVATRQTDCWVNWSSDRLHAEAVRPHAVEGG